jgi:hypothetical protein
VEVLINPIGSALKPAKRSRNCSLGAETLFNGQAF